MIILVFLQSWRNTDFLIAFKFSAEYRLGSKLIDQVIRIGNFHMAISEMRDTLLFTFVDDQAVTNDGAIDASSPLAWYIPEDRLTPRADTVDVLESVLAVDAPLDDDRLGALAP